MGSSESLTIMRMPDGGYLVSDGYSFEPEYMRRFRFASTQIEAALQYIREQIVPNKA